MKEEIESYFNALPENKVFIWFDPNLEYEKLLSHIKGDFTILKYEQNPLKMRYEIEYSDSDKKWVIYLPFSEKSEEISYLKSYTLTSCLFTQSLYAYLKKKGVSFPPGQKKIGEIKKKLPTLAVESIGKGESFWKDRFFKEETDIILPNFEEQLLNFVEEPEDTYSNLEDENKLDTFIKKVEDVFGFTADISNQPLWQFKFVSHLCIVEMYARTSKPDVFPLRNLLPEDDKFEKCINLIRKIRDNQRYREIYKDLTFEMENKYRSGLTKFANAHAFETDVETIKLLDKVAIKKLDENMSQLQTKDEFVREVLDRKKFIDKKAQNFWSRENEIIVWTQLQTICDLIESIDIFKSQLTEIKNEKDLIMKYCDQYYQIDKLYRSYLEKLRFDDERLENFSIWVEKLYIEFLDAINSKFSEFVSKKKVWSLEGIIFQGDFLRKFEKLGDGKRAIFMVDALRFELGKELEERLSGEYDVSLQPMYSQIPTKTQIGMAYLLSPTQVNLSFDGANISVQTEEGLDLSSKRNREQYIKSKLKSFDTINLNELNRKTSSEINAMKNSLIVFSTDLDKAGETGGIGWLTFLTSLLQEIARGVTKLHKNGFTEVHIVTDHGFLSFQDRENKFRTHLDEFDFVTKANRFIVGENIAQPNLMQFTIKGLKNKLLYFPWGIHYFKKDTFYHGGISIQETIIPYMIIKPRTGEPTKVDVKLEVEDGIYNRIFEVRLKPIIEKLVGKKPRTVEVMSMHDQEPISNKPAIMIENKEEMVRLRLIDTKYLSKGNRIKIVAIDQETQEILSETEVKIMIDLRDEIL